MTNFDEAIGRLRGLVVRLSFVLSSAEVREVEEFLEHAELGEALRTLAWIIVEENKRIALADLVDIQSLAECMGMSHELPESLPNQLVTVE